MARDQKDMEELRTLLIALETGDRDAGTFKQLARLLETSAQAREAYVNQIALDVQLEVEFAKSPVAVDLPQKLHSPVPSKEVPPGLRFFPSLRTNTRQALAALVFLSLAALIAIGYRFSRPIIPSTEAPVVSQPRVEQPVPVRPIVARITKQHRSRWLHTDFSQPSNGEPIALRGGEQLRISAGLVEITYESSARIVVEGPATFEVLGDKRTGGGNLREGTLSAIVPAAAKGFTIHTPEADVVDQGTEFSIRVTRSTEVHVFAGRVDIQTSAAAAPEARAVSSRQQNALLNRKKKTEVTSHKALRISQGGEEVEHLVASPDSFADSRAFLAGRQVVLLDDFDDGDPQTNTSGIGAGFSAVVFRNPWNWASESNGVLGLGITRSTRFPTLSPKLVYATSRDRFRVDGAMVTWKFRRLGDPHNSLVVAIVSHSEQSQGGIELAMRRPSNGSETPTFEMTAWSRPDQRVEYIRAGAETDAPATPSSPDWSQDVEIAMSLDRTGYQVSWRDSANRGRTWTGAWRTQPGFDFSQFEGKDGLAQLQLYPLGDPQTGSTIMLDRVIVTVPESGDK